MQQRSVTITLRPKSGLAPSVLALLASIPENFRYPHYGLRHPGGIFNLQFGGLAKDLTAVAKRVREFSGAPDLDALLRAYTALLFRFVNFLESPYEIFLGLCPPAKPPGAKEFVHRWLKAHGYKSGEKYFTEVEYDVRFFRELTNKLRHTSNILQPMFITHESGRHSVAYYLEGADTQGAIGPDEAFHQQYDNRMAPNSFHRDLRRLYYCMYKVADVVGECLREHHEQVTGSALGSSDVGCYDDGSYRELYAAIESLPELYFPSEEGADVPYPLVRESPDQPQLCFEFRGASPPLAGRHSFSGQSSGDGFSRTFRAFGIGGIPIPSGASAGAGKP